MRPHQTLVRCYCASFCYQKQRCKWGRGQNIENCKNHSGVPRLLAGIVELLRQVVVGSRGMLAYTISLHVLLWTPCMTNATICAKEAHMLWRRLPTWNSRYKVWRWFRTHGIQNFSHQSNWMVVVVPWQAEKLKIETFSTLKSSLSVDCHWQVACHVYYIRVNTSFCDSGKGVLWQGRSDKQIWGQHSKTKDSSCSCEGCPASSRQRTTKESSPEEEAWLW